MLGVILGTAVNAVAPIVLLIALGYILKRVGFLTADYLVTANKLMFHVCLPAMLFVNIYDIASVSDIRLDMMAFGFIMITLIFLIGWVFSVLATKDPRRRGAVWQCFFRSNFAIIGLPLAQSLGGAEGAAAAALLSAFSIPLFNVYGVIALSVYTGQKRSLGSVMKSIVVNPLTLGIFSGLIALAIRFGQLQLFGRVVFSLQRDTLFLYKVLNHLKAATTPMALVVLGGQCEFSAVKGMLKEILVAVGGRVVLAPVLALCTAITLSNMGWLPCGNGEYAALIALFGSPVAVVSAIIAGNMGSDKQLASQLVFWTSLISVGTIFITVCVLMATGYLVAL